VKFCLLDKIEHLDDTRIVASKSVTLAEEYLADHFPTFPVLPGVMMLEALTQAAAWVLHQRHGFARSMAVLKDARNVRYGQFVAPGDTQSHRHRQRRIRPDRTAGHGLFQSRRRQPRVGVDRRGVETPSPRPAHRAPDACRATRLTFK
jgi:3-hydroxymyristoyl/3-hydroxydecanoyl-(acyl carrier protein) dehydratase